jgi:hypothetical protein
MELTSVNNNHISPILPILSQFCRFSRKEAQKKGQKLYQKNDKYNIFRDVATLMEHPEFYSFYKKYLIDPKKCEKIMFVLDIYDTISQYISKHCPDKYNAYHKIFLLYIILERMHIQSQDLPTLTNH